MKVHKLVQTASGTVYSLETLVQRPRKQLKMEMQIFLALVLCVAVILSTNAAPTTSSVDYSQETKNKTVFKYDIKVRAENGQTLVEKLEINTKTRTELVRVPKHGKEEEIELLEDYSKNLTAIHIKAKNLCYVFKMISAVLSDEFKGDFGNLEQQSIVEAMNDTSARAETTSWKVDAVLTQRFLLSEEMAMMCARSSIYWAQKIEGTGSVRQARDTGHPRNRRSACVTSKYCVTLCRIRIVTLPNGTRVRRCFPFNYCIYVASC